MVFTIMARVSVFLIPALLIASLTGCHGRVMATGHSGEVITPAAPANPAGNPQLTNQLADSPENTAKDFPPASGLEETVPEDGVTDGSSMDKTAYLTFDDGPNSFFTGSVLDILADRRVKATFMVMGQNAGLNSEVLQRIIDEGHGLGNHTFSHDYNKIYASPEAFLSDLEECNQVLTRYTGNPVKVFRAPGGPQKLSPDYMNYLSRNGYISVGWNVTSADSDPNGTSPAQIYKNIVNGVEKVEQIGLSPIILMHDGTHLTTIEAAPGTPLAAYIQNRKAIIGALPDIIDHLKSKGYKFAPVDENTPPAW